MIWAMFHVFTCIGAQTVCAAAQIESFFMFFCFHGLGWAEEGNTAFHNVLRDKPRRSPDMREVGFLTGRRGALGGSRAFAWVRRASRGAARGDWSGTDDA
jgi:hypothetical protein